MNGEHDHPEHLSERMKEIAKDLEPQFTQLEQQPPNKPSFLLVVLLSGVVIIILFILAIIVLHLGSGRFGRHSFRAHPTSQLTLPASASPEALLINVC